MSLADCVDLVGFFFNDTATTEIYTLSLHDALPICPRRPAALASRDGGHLDGVIARRERSEEHTSELQSRPHLVCRLLLEKHQSALDSRLGTYAELAQHGRWIRSILDDQPLHVAMNI